MVRIRWRELRIILIKTSALCMIKSFILSCTGSWIVIKHDILTIFFLDVPVCHKTSLVINDYMYILCSMDCFDAAVVFIASVYFTENTDILTSAIIKGTLFNKVL